ncbi:MAG: hypothetical protein RLZZ178_866 [Verrucomicrobiota bacterium]|jgi:hypothetical protein
MTWIPTLASLTVTVLIMAGLRKITRSWRRRLSYRRRIRRNEAYWESLRADGPGASQAPRLRIVVSLTTSPARLAELEPVLASLTSGQTRRPDEIHLNLPWRFLRTGEGYVLPEFLSRYDVKVFRTPDMGPATKLIPTLERVTDPETWIMTVDDDVRHLPQAVATLEDAAAAAPGAAHGFSDYALWRKWKPGEPVDILAGFGGCLYRRGFFGPDFPAYFEALSGNRPCFFQDDVVLSNYLARRGIPRHRVHAAACHLELMKERGCLLEQAAGDDALSHGAGSGLNTHDRSLEAMAFLRSVGLAALPGPRD